MKFIYNILDFCGLLVSEECYEGVRPLLRKVWLAYTLSAIKNSSLTSYLQFCSSPLFYKGKVQELFQSLYSRQNAMNC